ncbi:MAG: tRNA 4-thiouridine(8) synthase ThiI, partial [Clostridia bacterium]|nr:tRNA 4-thiouridine(8) synthase ThiI [Clostridia bacterium]
MKEILLVKYGEIILKGGNRSRFEKTLIENMSNALKNVAETKITVAQATVYVDVLDGDKIDLVAERLAKVFGIVSIVKASVCEKTVEA